MPSKQKKTKSSKQSRAVVHQKVYRDNIQGIIRPALQRIMQRAGVRRISNPMYEELRGSMKHFMNTIMQKMVVFVEHDQRKTVQISDLEGALEMNNIHLAAGLNSNANKTKTLQSCNARGKSGLTKKSKTAESSDKKPHRFRPGTRAARSIKYQQKNSDCLAIPMANFDRLTRELAQDNHEGSQHLRFSEGVIELFQLVTEDYLIQLCKDAYEITCATGRDTIYDKDVQLVKRLRRGSFYV